MLVGLVQKCVFKRTKPTNKNVYLVFMITSTYRLIAAARHYSRGPSLFVHFFERVAACPSLRMRNHYTCTAYDSAYAFACIICVSAQIHFVLKSLYSHLPGMRFSVHVHDLA